MILRHWTAAIRVPLIVKAGVILPTESNVSLTEEHAGPDVVWLLPPDVHPGSGEDNGLSPVKRGGWIDVDVAAIRWREWEWTAKMTPSWRRHFVKVGGGPAMAAQWYVFPGPIRAWRFVATSENNPD